MPEPKKRTSKRRRGQRRSHAVLKLARRVNSKSPVKIYTTKRESAAKSQTKPKRKKTKKQTP